MGAVAGVAGGYRRLQVCDERCADTLLGFMDDLVGTLIGLKSLN
jgi:hypothetical protein